MQYASNEKALEAFVNINSEEITALENTIGTPFNILPDSEFFTLLGKDANLQSQYEEFLVSYFKFYDAYENFEINTKNLKLMNKPSVSAYSINEHEYYEELGIAIPFYESPISVESYSTFNISAANSYASTYAITYNSSSYGWLSADCTNFASQILRAGGKTEVSSSDKKKGWWYNKSTHTVCSPATGCYTEPYFVYSNSWINAASFSNYFGKDYTYKNSYANLKPQLREGDFIALDEISDGTPNHIGYVYDVIGSGSTKKIYIAQHSTNYKKEISSTNWGSSCNGGTCHIIRP